MPRTPCRRRADGLTYCLVLATVPAIQGCDAEMKVECVSTAVRPALTRATDSAEYLALSAAQENAVLSVRVPGAGAIDQGQCSGVLVSPQLVLTAKHCVALAEREDVIVSLGRDADQPAALANVESIGTHDTLDLALVELSAPFAASLELTPIPPATRAMNLRAGEIVQVSGYGYDEHGASGTRAFLVSEIVDVAAHRIAVTSDGYAGACFGDSGGPLLVRDAGGIVRVMGILSDGSVSCYGEDSYTRVDIANDWIVNHMAWPNDIAALEVDPLLGREGRCFGRTAVRFELDEARAEVCPDTFACGWSSDEQGFRCVTRSADLCDGVSATGFCEDERAVRCILGNIERQPCGACGASCSRSPRDGNVRCTISGER